MRGTPYEIFTLIKYQELEKKKGRTGINKKIFVKRGACWPPL